MRVDNKEIVTERTPIQVPGHVGALLIAGICLYQRRFAHFYAGACRYVPSCSQFAIEAIQRYGAMVGFGMAVRRLLRCNPRYPAGDDPLR